MDVVIGPLFELILIVLNIYIWVVLASVIMSWLYAFNVINSSNRVVYLIGDFLYRATEPALRPIRRIIPNLGGLDLSPLALLLIIYFLQRVLTNVAYRMGAFG